MSQNVGKNNNKVYKLVLTGGPCGGKTTGQARLCTFFENLGWRVFRVPETATVLISGGVKWSDMNEEEVFKFQENLIKTMMQIEQTYFDLAATCQQNCLVICDRGAMDASAYLETSQWERMKLLNGWNNVDLRDNRYNQVLHMVSAAKGAEAFYQTESHVIRHEDVDFARKLDDLTSQAWVGHPYYDVIDNSTDFERKMVKTMAAVCNRLSLKHGDRLRLDSRKRKFLVKSLPDEQKLQEMVTAQKDGAQPGNAYPQFQDFIVMHDYLVTPSSKMQARIRRRGQNVKWDDEIERWNFDSGNWTYTHTIRRPKIKEEAPELKMQITLREYELLLAQKDMKHYTIYKKRRCFLWNNQYFQMDIYQEPCPPRCKGLIILETYTSQTDQELELPDFLEIERQITEDSDYSMYNLSVKPESALYNRVRSMSEGEDLVKLKNGTNGGGVNGVNGGSKANGHANGHLSKKHSVHCDGRMFEVIVNGTSNNNNLINTTSGSTNDVWMSCDSSGDSS